MQSTCFCEAIIIVSDVLAILSFIFWLYEHFTGRTLILAGVPVGDILAVASFACLVCKRAFL